MTHMHRLGCCEPTILRALIKASDFLGVYTHYFLTLLYSGSALGLKEELADCRRRIKDLEDRFGALEQAKLESNTTKPLIVCLIDGDGCIFTKEAIEGAHEGGRTAARVLKEHIQNDYKELIPGDYKENCILLVDIFIKGGGLKKTLYDHLRIERDTFDKFITGFNASSSMTIMDVGEGIQAVDNKICDLMRIFVNDPRVKRVYFGGGHDGGYAPILSKAEEGGHLHKIVLLQGYDQLAPTIKAYNLPSLKIDELFLAKKLPDRNKAPNTTGQTSRPTSRLTDYND
ncbi:hypothetical protein BDV93DRAFT_546539 [Ceratobasidium sp. AG-I]|nr:hypothetical protein BDV93DRAFT_546539 [Ceratobasidium sp. AG-I]